MHTAFISYSSEDKAVAFGACKALEASGVTCWIAPRDVMAGRPYSGQISEAIRRARAFVLGAAAKIQHPHVAAIHHLGQEGEDYFYTMELVDGEDMEHYVQARGPLSPGAALRVVLQVAEALEAAQVHKLIHRDIKPANIMARVNRAGKLDVKLIDFGLAKGAGPGSQDLSRVTHTMSFVGSPAYASPEQCEMGDLETRSDIYSLGATLWSIHCRQSLLSQTVRSLQHPRQAELEERGRRSR